MIFWKSYLPKWFPNNVLALSKFSISLAPWISAHSQLTTIWPLLCRGTIKCRKSLLWQPTMGFFSFRLNCEEPTNFTFQRQYIPPCRGSPTRKARGSNPPGCTKQWKSEPFLDRRRVRIFCFLRKWQFWLVPNGCVSKTLSKKTYHKSHNCKGAVRQKGHKHEVRCKSLQV